jgi:hypothetical protein
MAKTKKELTALEKLQAAFSEDFNDMELQERYDRFVENVKYWKGLYNDLVPKINEQIKQKSNLTTLVLDSAMLGILNTEAVNQIKELDKYLNEWCSKADDYRAKFEDEERLMKKYEENSHDRLFQWWKSIKTVDEKTAPWLEWKRPYEKRII